MESEPEELVGNLDWIEQLPAPARKAMMPTITLPAIGAGTYFPRPASMQS